MALVSALAARPGWAQERMVTEFLEQAIAFHGGEVLERARVRVDLCSKSGCSALDVTEDEGLFRYCVEAAPGDERRKVCIDNDTVSEWQGGVLVSAGKERAQKLRDWVMERVYFVFLPYRLRDPSVRAQDLGLETWGTRTLRKIKVTFEPESSTDADDEFLYWFEPSSGQLEQFAYSYNRSGGGLRFRTLVEPRRVGGILFFDQENFGIEGEGLSVDSVSADYIQGEMRHVSTITLSNIRVQEGGGQ